MGSMELRPLAAEARLFSRLVSLNIHLRGEGTAPDGRAPGLRHAPAFCVARDGRVVSFVAPEEIEPRLRDALRRWEADRVGAEGPLAVASACAALWLRLIAIHPFVDGNGRAAKAFLLAELEALGYGLAGFELIERHLIEGRPEDLAALACLFLASFSRVPTPPHGGSA